MVRAIGKESKIVGTGLMIVKLACDSDDVKPVNGVATGSTCLEVDTGDLYIFSEDNKTWNFLKNVGSEGGGGGDSDFSTAEVTVVKDTENDFILILPNILDGVTGYSYVDSADLDDTPLTAILYKNTMSPSVISPDGIGLIIEGSGNVIVGPNNTVIAITGDCVLTIKNLTYPL